MDKKRHLLVISQYFYPEQFRINDLCREWVKRGYQVTVVTGIPNYPNGKYYPGYKWYGGKEEYEGIHIIRLPLIPRGNNSVMLALNYASFVFSGRIWSWFTKVNADKVFIFEVSPMTQALTGVWYAKRRKIPCYIYVQDLWPENVEVVTGIHNRHFLGGISKMVDYIYDNCRIIFATSPSFVKRIEERKSAFQGEKSKVVYWPQYAEDFYVPLMPLISEEIPQNNKYKIVFTGNIGYAQGLEILPETAKLLKKEGVSCEFYIIGDGRYRKEMENTIEKNEVSDMFHMLGRKAPEEIPQYLANCDAAFLSFADNPLFGMTIPAKLQSYLACGMPTIAAAVGETERIIQESGAGMVCRIGAPSALAETIKAMMNKTIEEGNKMRENALVYYRNHFSRSVLIEKMEKYLEG